jgi:hypothetical protein
MNGILLEATELTGWRNNFFIVLSIVVFITLFLLARDKSRGLIAETILGAPSRLVLVIIAVAFLGYVHSCQTGISYEDDMGSCLIEGKYFPFPETCFDETRNMCEKRDGSFLYGVMCDDRHALKSP